MDKSRFRNYGLWVAIAALIPMVLQGFGLDILPSNYKDIINAILSILVMAGILNDPTTAAKWFLDDKKKAKAEKSEEAYDEITQATISRENEEKK
ncbi:phage holin [Clostridium manihotivorum]|uniref:Holin n=1 Tax=Clostridium manihotivorum TaxID=2320868 RepID=A0A410DXX5_9CLOT|nr:phage holin [Clostridium manihotivorum]QAA34036.1 holin [Clostridium manihotivorum]